MPGSILDRVRNLPDPNTPVTGSVPAPTGQPPPPALTQPPQGSLLAAVRALPDVPATQPPPITVRPSVMPTIGGLAAQQQMERQQRLRAQTAPTLFGGGGLPTYPAGRDVPPSEALYAGLSGQALPGSAGRGGQIAHRVGQFGHEVPALVTGGLGAVGGGMVAGPGGAMFGSTLGPTLLAGAEHGPAAASEAFKQSLLMSPLAIGAPEFGATMGGPRLGAAAGAAGALVPAAIEGRMPTPEEALFAALPLAHGGSGSLLRRVRELPDVPTAGPRTEPPVAPRTPFPSPMREAVQREVAAYESPFAGIERRSQVRQAGTEQAHNRRASDIIDTFRHLDPAEADRFKTRLRDERTLEGKAAILEEAHAMNSSAGQIAENQRFDLERFGTEEPGVLAGRAQMPGGPDTSIEAARARLLPGGRGEPTAAPAPEPSGRASEIPLNVRSHTVESALGELPQGRPTEGIPTSAADLDAAMAEMRGESTPATRKRAAEMSARLREEPGPVGPIGTQEGAGGMPARDLVNLPEGTTRVAPETVATETFPRSWERGSAPLGLAAPGAAAIEAGAGKVRDVIGARDIEGPQERDLGISKWFLTPQHNLARYGPKAKAAIDDILLTGERIHRESQQRLHDWMEPLRGGLKPHDSAAIADLIEGKTTTPATKEQAAVVAHLKPRFEAARKDYIAYAKSRGFTIPADWGIKDYLPHYFPGEFRIFVKNAATGGRDLVGSAYSKLDAMAEIRRIATERNLKPADLEVGHTKFAPPDVTRVSNPNKWRMVNEIADAAGIDKQDIADAMRGVIGTREGKSKWWANVQRRKGSAGYSKDVAAIVQRYVTSQTRHMELSKLNARIQPAIRDLRNAGLTNVADEVQSNLDMLWGVRSDTAKALDATLAKTPGINLIHRYGALERWTGRTRGTLARLMLMTPKFHFVMQPLQLAQTLYPVVGEAGMARALKLYGSSAGRTILDQHGVKYGVSRWTEGIPMSERLISKVTSPKVRAQLERLAEMGSSETRNQEISFLALYDHAKRVLKMGDTEAANYARLRGQFMTQFYPSVADMPKMMRGPIGKSIFQFRRFNIKNLELGMTLLREKNYPGAARWLGVNLLLGGLKTGLKIGAPLAGLAAVGRLRQAPTYLSLKEYHDIKDKYGESAADVIMYGMPGLLGIDLSNSVQMVDVPFGGSLPEMVGNTVLGPAGQLATSAITAGSASPGPEPSAAKRIGRSVAQRVPAVRMLDSVRRLFTHDYDYTTPDGRLKFKADAREVWKQLGGFRSTDRSDEELFLNAMTEVTASRSEAMNDAISHAMGGDVAKGREIALSWNSRWPEFPITNTDIKHRMSAKQKMQVVPLPQRLYKSAPKTIQRGMAPLTPESAQQP